MKVIPWIVLGLVALRLDAATINAPSCSQADVQNSVNAAQPGDTVTVPAGTCSWSGIALNGKTLIGAGKTASGTVITAGKVTMTKNSGQVTRLSGFRFTGTDIHAVVTGAVGSRAYRIDNNYFFASQNDFVDLNANGGVVDHNDFFMNPSQVGGPDVMMIHPGEDWSQPTTMGTGDITGERNLYFEDNTFTNVLETAPDGDQGARIVIRHNLYTDSSIVFHSGQPNDTSTDGTRQFEVYSNTFKRVNINNNVNKWIWVRGGSGVIANNVMDVVSTSQFGGKVQISLGVGCPVAYPVPHQIGQTSTTPQSPPPQPLLIFGNTGAGTSGSSFLVIGANNTGGGGSTGCSNPASFVQSGRDYFTSNQWSWTPYTYPHPLVSGGAPPPPLIPAITSNLNAIGTVGTVFSYTVTATNNPTSFAATGLPAGLGMNSASGVITGTPTTATTSAVVLSATNSAGTGTATLTLVVSGGSGGGTPPHPYTTSFLLTENPISENGFWINGGTVGLDWHNMRTTAGIAFGTQPATIKYDDSTAVLAGSWGPNQSAQATIRINTTDATQFEEVEVRLHTTIAAHSITGYEISCSIKTGSSGTYLQIVRWNGPLGNFTQLDSRGIQCNNGDVLMAQNVGSTITAYLNGVAQYSVTDGTYTGGAPGIGHYIENGVSSSVANFGLSSFTASDSGTPPPPQPPVITSGLTATATVGSMFSYTIAATNQPTAYGAANLPTGLTINTATGLISGTPTLAGAAAVSISATNTAGTGVATLNLTISPMSTPPITGTIVCTSTIVCANGTCTAAMACTPQ